MDYGRFWHFQNHDANHMVALALSDPEGSSYIRASLRRLVFSDSLVAKCRMNVLTAFHTSCAISGV